MVYIIVLNWNGWKDTVECLDSVLQMSFKDYRLVVIDNGSSDDSEDQLIAWANSRLNNGCVYYDLQTSSEGGDKALEQQLNAVPPGQQMVLIQTGENLGYAGGNNVGLTYALIRGAAYVWILNNDTTVDQEALGSLVRRAEAEPSIGMVGSKVLNFSDRRVLQAAGGGHINRLSGRASYLGCGQIDGVHWNQPVDLDHLLGASILVRSNAVHEVGLFDERFFLCMEEIDWCLRARRARWRVVYCPLSRVYHKGSVSFGRSNTSQLYYNQRNTLILAEKNFPSFVPVILVGGFLWKVGKRLLSLDFSGATVTLHAYRDYAVRRFGKRPA